MKSGNTIGAVRKDTAIENYGIVIVDGEQVLTQESLFPSAAKGEQGKKKNKKALNPKDYNDMVLGV